MSLSLIDLSSDQRLQPMAEVVRAVQTQTGDMSDGDLVDPTLTDLARNGHAYLEHIDPADLFLNNAKAWAEVPVAIGEVPDILGNHCQVDLLNELG